MDIEERQKGIIMEQGKFKVGDLVTANEKHKTMCAGDLCREESRITSINDMVATLDNDATLPLGDLELVDDTNQNFNGVLSTKAPRLELIFKSALVALANRCELGIERKGEGALNALTPHEISKALVLERLSHCILHCYDAIEKVAKDKVFEGEEDAGAILWAGQLLAEYKERLRKEI